ncbi:MAG: hypothetical protein PHQ22_05735 [Sulfuricurvum sp.]|nr:hypothetical protein [Sulfuricurvum sp.]MDD5386677.1 hypothetical protein [Sulfuricurvum sp.]
MIYRHQQYEIDLTKVTRLYPAALISVGGERASVSLEWADMKKEQIIFEAYVLICDFDPVGEVPMNRIEVQFETKEELFGAMNDIALLLREKR